MRTEIPREWTASAATKRLSWSWTMKRRSTRAAMPETTARKAFTFGGCRLTHVVTAWIDVLWGLMGSLIDSQCYSYSSQHKLTHTTKPTLDWNKQTKQEEPNAKMQIDFFFLFSLSYENNISLFFITYVWISEKKSILKKRFILSEKINIYFFIFFILKQNIMKKNKTLFIYK